MEKLLPFLLPWLQEHLLALVAVTLTSVLLYFYLIERDLGPKLSKKYRNSIFEAQSKIFLSATRYLIEGNKDLAIKEFLNAVDLNRETIDTYFALGGLFRSNGEIEKAISIHRSLIARENISEAMRIRALKELAIDFDKGGFIDKAIETYKDVLKINRDQHEVILSLCRIYEDIEEWDEAFQYRLLLSKLGPDNQSETISHILVQKAKKLFQEGDFVRSGEELEMAFRYAPSISAKMLRLKLHLLQGKMEDGKILILEIVKEHPLYTPVLFDFLQEDFHSSPQLKDLYAQRFQVVKNYFLSIKDKELHLRPNAIISKIKLLRNEGRLDEAYNILKIWINENAGSSEVLLIEYIMLLIEMDRRDEALLYAYQFFQNWHKGLTKHFCGLCGYNSDTLFWRCPQCREWESIQFRLKI